MMQELRFLALNALKKIAAKNRISYKYLPLYLTNIFTAENIAKNM